MTSSERAWRPAKHPPRDFAAMYTSFLTQPGGSRSTSSSTTSDLKRDAVSCMLAVIGDDRRGASHRDPDLSPWVTAPPRVAG
jgi:hypothetical protein